MHRWSIRGYLFGVAYLAGSLTLGKFLLTFYFPKFFGGH
jgi:hypothetical protein